jgi:hypothetical protein
MARVSRLIALLSAALAGLLLSTLIAPASAHPGHRHGMSSPAHRSAPASSAITAPAQTDRAAVAETRSSTTVDAPKEGPFGQPSHRPQPDGVEDDLAARDGKPPAPLHQGNCCCGSVACHAGVPAAVQGAREPSMRSEKLDLPPVRAVARTEQGGIERPPRGRMPL